MSKTGQTAGVQTEYKNYLGRLLDRKTKMKAFGPASRGNEDVAQKLSGLSATHGKETAHGDDPLHVRQVRVEGLASS
jgi:hypothetical protein